MVKIENLTVRFKDNTVLDNFNAVFDDEIYCIYAPSGSGKTTLLNAVAGLIAYTGNIELTGNVCYVFQEDTLLPWLSARENVLLTAKDTDKAEYYIKRFGIDEFADKLPKKLSGGMKRRAALARGLAFGGDVYLLDEPFAGLDGDNTVKVAEEIKSLSGTVLVVTHDNDDCALLDAKRFDLR